MLKNIFNIIRRLLKRNRAFFIINILGYSLALAISFIMLEFILNEVSYDKYHKNKERIFRVICENKNAQWSSPQTPYTLTEYLKTNFPEIETTAPIGNFNANKYLINNDQFGAGRILATTNDLFKILTINFIEGNPDNVLQSETEIIISESLAKKHFPNQHPIGEIITLVTYNKEYNLIVSGVFKDIPKFSKLRSNFFININLVLNDFENNEWSKNIRTDWSLDFFRTYLMLNNKKDLANFENKIRKLEKDPFFKEIERNYSIQNIEDIYLNSSHLVNAGKTGNKKYVIIFSFVAILIIIVTILNYIIFELAQLQTKSKEIGIRKVAGATKLQLIKLQIGESLIIALLAFCLGFIIAELLIPYVNNLFGINITLSILKSNGRFFIFFSLTIIIGILSGLYIGHYFSRLNPVLLFRKNPNGNGKFILQNSLLITQLIVFIGMLLASLVIWKQINFFKNADLGFDSKDISYAYVEEPEFTHSNYGIFKHKLLESPYIKDITGGYGMPPTNSRAVSSVTKKDSPEEKIVIETIECDFDFIDVLKLKIISGRNFNSSFTTDSNKVIINKSAALSIFEDINPVGELLNEKEIIGVIEDFHMHSLHEEIPLIQILISPPEYIEEFFIKIEQNKYKEANDHIVKTISNLTPDSYFETYSFEDSLSELYHKEMRFGNIIIVFTLCTIFISFIGLFAQSLYHVRQRRKEICIRLVFGANTKNILKLFSLKYLSIIIIANIISWPFTIYLIKKWLQQFAYKTNIELWMLSLTLVVSVIIVLSIVMINTLKISKTNPAKILHYE